MGNFQSKHGLGFLVRASNAFDTAENVAATAAVHGEYYVTKPCSVSEFKFIVTTAIVGTTTAPIVALKRRPTPGSATGEVTIANMTLPNGTAAGKVVSVRFAPVQLNVGDALNFEHITQAAGSPAGAGFYDVVLEQDFEVDGNQSDLVNTQL